jgi:hypothetical protein
MRWLTLLLALSAVVTTIVTTEARAVPQADAEQAYQRGDYATAFKLWLPLAEAGSARAQENVARMYERGQWVAQDPAMANEWYRRAAEQRAQDGAMPVPAAVQAAQQINPPVQPPMQTTYTPLAARAPAAAPVSYPVRAPYCPPPVHHHHHHHGGHRH